MGNQKVAGKDAERLHALHTYRLLDTE